MFRGDHYCEALVGDVITRLAAHDITCPRDLGSRVATLESRLQQSFLLSSRYFARFVCLARQKAVYTDMKQLRVFSFLGN